MRFSLLDRSRTRAGEHEAAALPHSVQRAESAAAMGYHRFWVAEHHGVQGIASGSPAVLLAAIGARTPQIRLGSGGVMLPNHRPLLVAEQFLMLDSLYPGRIDLGVGRSLGFTGPVREALGRSTASAEEFAEEVRAVRAYLDGTGPVTARPRGERPLPLFLLATGSGMETAAALGVPLVIGGPILDSEELPGRLAAYRKNFRPHQGSSPEVVLSAEVLIADTEAGARELALPEIWAMTRSRTTGVFQALQPVAQIRNESWSAKERAGVERGYASALVGTADIVRRRLERLAELTGGREILSSASTYDREALAASDRELARLLGG